MTDSVRGPAGSDRERTASLSHEDKAASPEQIHTDSSIEAADVSVRARSDQPENNAAPAPVQETMQRIGTASGTKKTKSATPELESLEQFIAYAYSRKGQQVFLKPKIERKLAERPKLDNATRQRLLELAQKDLLLTVPRQLLLIGMQLNSSVLSAEVREFVGDVLCEHRAFGSPALVSALKNLPDSPDIARALELAASISFPMQEMSQGRPLKRGEISRLRINAAYCLAIWFVETRGISLAELSRALFTALWQPQSARNRSVAARLRYLTEMFNVAGVGVATQVFKEEADRQAGLAEVAWREKESVLTRALLLEGDLERLQEELEDRDQQIVNLNDNLNDQKTSYEDTLAHQRDEFQHLRGRMLRRLRSEVSLLDEALHALRKNPPKVDVMDDHAERVVEALRAEIKNLEETE
jgi:hypothetical protein